MTNASRKGRRTSLRRLVVKAAGKAGFTISRAAPGAVLVARSGDWRTTPLVSNARLLTDRSKKAPTVRAVKSGVAVVTAPGTAAATVQSPVRGKDGLVIVGGDDKQVSIGSVGANAAVVLRTDLPPREALTMETDVLRHLGDHHLAWLLQRYRIDCVIDVGANNGQYGRTLRRAGFRGRIISVEPVPSFADAVRSLAEGDDEWVVEPIALGESDGVVPIRVQRTFSSALPASEYGKHRFATLRDFAETEQIEVPLRRLDTVLDEWLAPLVARGIDSPRVFLKMDTQGLDLQVFAGLGERAQDIVALQSEVALLLIYENMPRMPESLAVYEGAGFELTGLYPVTREPDGRIIEYDCMMVRSDRLPPLSAAP